MISKKIEKEFDITIIASFIENKVLVVLNKNYSANKRTKIMKNFENDLFDFCSFITGENIDYSNLSLYAPTIKKLLIEQYPNMYYKLLYFDEYKTLTDKEIIYGINIYKKTYGDKIKIKSLKKELSKTLKNS